MTHNELRAQHQANEDFVRLMLNVCRTARRLLRHDKPEDYEWLLEHADAHNRPDLLPLRDMVRSKALADVFEIKFQSYKRGILAKVFDARRWIVELRLLRFKELAQCQTSPEKKDDQSPVFPVLFNVDDGTEYHPEDEVPGT